VEWPTILVAVSIWGGLAATAAAHRSLPWVATIPILGILGAWYSSLQHEVIHGHPTPSTRVNVALAGVPLGLVVPFWLYRDTHLRHHRDETLTDPALDPESFYVSADAWARSGRATRAVLIARQTFVGRLLLQPLLTPLFVGRELRGSGSWSNAGRAVRSIAASAVVVAVVVMSGLPLWEYLLGFCYLGSALICVRSFAEHRATSANRSAIVTTNWFWRLLFLNNHLHAVHHRRPDVAWFRLPAVHRELGARPSVPDTASAGAGDAAVHGGYWRLFLDYGLRPIFHPVHPGFAPIPVTSNGARSEGEPGDVRVPARSPELRDALGGDPSLFGLAGGSPAGAVDMAG
jgi:fatty acid desaturase